MSGRAGCACAVAWLAVLAACPASPLPPPADDDAAIAGLDRPTQDRASLDVAAVDASTVDAVVVDAAGGTVESGAVDAAVAVDAQVDASVSSSDSSAPDTHRPEDAGPPSLVEIAIEGFGQDTLGGWQPGRDEVIVTSLDDDGPGTLRQAVASGGAPRVVRFGVDGTIVLASPISLPSNLTIDGRGRHVELQGKGLGIHGQSHVILTHLAIVDVEPSSEDGVQIGAPGLPPSHHVVLDHLRLAHSDDTGDYSHVDEAVSVVFGAHSVTIQWCRFEAWEKVLLFGNGDAPAEVDGAITVTLHHNLFLHTGRRHPRLRYGRVDMYSNALVDWRPFYSWGEAGPQRSFGVWAELDGQIRLEHNVFERHPAPYETLTSWVEQATRCAALPLSTESGTGRIAASGHHVVPGSTALEFEVGCDPGAEVFARPYPATVDVAGETLRQRLLDEAGDG